MYCLKCKGQTDTINVTDVISKNDRKMKQGYYIKCGTKKSTFPKEVKNGGSYLNKTINNLPFELHLPGHSFTGPGTKLNIRLNPDDTPKKWSVPINRVDETAYKHDLCYRKNKDTETRNKVCDKNMLKELNDIDNPTIREKFDRAIVKPIIGTKIRFGLGLKKKKLNGLMI